MASASNIRRWLAGVCLSMALLMLIVGLTALGGSRLSLLQFVVYWSLCALLTVLAALVAMIDLLLLRRQLRQAQKQLIEQTLRDARKEQDGETH